MTKRRAALLEVLIDRVGLRRAVTLATFFVKWGMWLESEPADPSSVEEFAEFAMLSRAQAFRQRQWWREAVPELGEPGELWERVRDQIDRKSGEGAVFAQTFAVMV